MQKQRAKAWEGRKTLSARGDGRGWLLPAPMGGSPHHLGSRVGGKRWGAALLVEQEVNLTSVC